MSRSKPVTKVRRLVLTFAADEQPAAAALEAALNTVHSVLTKTDPAPLVEATLSIAPQNEAIPWMWGFGTGVLVCVVLLNLVPLLGF